MKKNKIFFISLLTLVIFLGSFLRVTASWEDECIASGGTVLEIKGKLACSWDPSTASSWQTSANGGSTGYSTTTSVLGSGNFLPPPGCSNHLAQTSDGTLSSTGTVCFDPIAPYIATEKLVLGAGHAKEASIVFDDLFEGERLSGVASAEITVVGATGTENYSQICNNPSEACIFSFTHDFKETGFYSLSWKATDVAGNTASGEISNFFQVVAGEPIWNENECYELNGENLNLETECPSKITISPSKNTALIADGEDEYSINVHLSDRYGNRIIPIKDIKNVDILFDFENTVDLNQIAKTGDAARFLSEEISFDQSGADSGNTHLTEIGWLSEKPEEIAWNYGSAIDASCGAAAGKKFSESPEIVAGDLLCQIGSFASSVAKNENDWEWTCESESNDSIEECSAEFVSNGTCGLAADEFSEFPPTENLCESSSIEPIISRDAGSWIWACFGSNGGTSEVCETPGSRVANTLTKIYEEDRSNSNRPFLGTDVSISGEEIAIGAPDYHNTGAVYLSDIDGNKKILQADLPEEFSSFGYAVALDGDKLAVGAPDANSGAGAVYFFKKIGNEWLQEQKIAGEAKLNFGKSVDLEGNDLIVGSVDTASIFDLNSSQWSLKKEFFSENSGDSLGFQVGISNDFAVIGAPNYDCEEGDGIEKSDCGAIYLTEKINGSWQNLDKKTSADSLLYDYENDKFGAAVAIDDNKIVIGAIGIDKNIFDEGRANIGAIYVLERDASGWSDPLRINNFDGDRFDNFGNAVDVSGDFIIAGAFHSQNEEEAVDVIFDSGEDEVESTGSAYVFEKIDGNWTQKAKLLPDISENWEEFGYAVAINNNGVAVAGTPRKDDNSGAIYIFRDYENTLLSADAKCGISADRNFVEQPTANFCVDGALPEDVLEDRDLFVWNWNCPGFNGGEDRECSAKIFAEYSWQKEACSPCDCESNTQTCDIFCERADGARVTDEFCSGEKPTTESACSLNICE